MKNPNRRFKDAIYEQFSRISKALAHPKRLELLDILCQGERTVEVLSGETGMSTGSTSQHLQVLRNARLLEAQKEGLYVTYRLADQGVCEFALSLRLLAENRLAEVEQITHRFLEGREGMEPVNKDELVDRIRESAVTVLDVRPAEEYNAGHLPGSISVPLEELEKHLSTLPTDKTIVAYCRGPYCVLAVQAVEKLHAEGFHAVRLDWGIQDWRARGLPVAAGEECGE